jgi:hypothetical protein
MILAISANWITEQQPTLAAQHQVTDVATAANRNTTATAIIG